MMCECGGGEGVGAGGGNVAEGAEDELALEHKGMGDCEMGRLEDEVVVEEDVEIDCARAFVDCFCSTEGVFNFFELF